MKEARQQQSWQPATRYPAARKGKPATHADSSQPAARVTPSNQPATALVVDEPRIPERRGTPKDSQYKKRAPASEEKDSDESDSQPDN
jgi:hypothetical protein